VKSQPLVSIMILGWNNYSDVINCLNSLVKITYQNYNVVLVDNGSREVNFDKFISHLKRSKTKYIIFDGEISQVKKPKSRDNRLFIIKSKQNLGFTGGSNLGLSFTWKVCNPKYLLLLNGDTIVTENFLSELVEACEKDKKIGSAQSALIRFDKKTIDSLGFKMVGYKAYDSHTGEEVSILADFERYQEIFGCCGASAIYRADLISRIGLFDEDLFATYEDYDLAWKIRLAGFKSVLARDSVVYHRGGVSRFRKDHVIFDMRSYYAAKNSLVIYNRYYPISAGVVTTSLVRFMVGLISAVRNQRVKEFASIIYNFPRERKEISKNKRLRNVQREWLRRK